MPPRQPLREHSFRIITVLVSMVIALACVFFIVPAVTGRPERGPFWAYLVGLVVGLAVAAGLLSLGIAIGRCLVGDRIEVALRQPGEKWRHGRLTVSPGTMTFERYRWQMRIPSGEKTPLTNVTLGPDTGQRPPLRHLWSINPQLHIVSLGSDQGQFEVGALPSRIDRLRDAVDARGTD